MSSLRGSLVEMFDLNAHTALVDVDTPAGRRALARTTLLLLMIEKLDASGGGWDGSDAVADPWLMESSLEAALVAPGMRI